MLDEADVQRCFASEYVTARQQFLIVLREWI